MTDLAEVIALLDLDEVGPDLFRGRHPEAKPPRAFGGQVMSQALMAAGATVSTDRLPHSLHCYFIRGGRTTLPTFFRVTRVRDGGSLSVRRVSAVQGDETIFEMTASFITDFGPTSESRVDLGAPDPNGLQTVQERLAAYADEMDGWWVRERPFDVRPVGPPPRAALDEPAGAPPGSSQMWLRAAGSVPRTPLLQRCLLAYASDLTLLEPVLIAHRRTTLGPGSIASLDHAMWFHRTPDMEEWLFYEAEVLGEAPRRGLCGGRFTTEDGLLVATVSQEGYLSPHSPSDWAGPRFNPAERQKPHPSIEE